MEEIKIIDFVFVILHYNKKTLKDTFECVESLEYVSKEKQYKIIIVENGSQDCSAEELIKKYKNNQNVECLICEENLGFAKGNNKGCNYAKNKYNLNYLIVMNNDTYIKQENFLNILEQLYEENKFDILGPYIYDKNFKPQNPVLNLKTQIKEVDDELLKIEIILNTNIFKVKIKKYLKKLVYSNKKLEKIAKLILKKQKSESIDKLAEFEIKDIGLHGSCLIFSKNYIFRYSEIFYSKTFLYVEEDILYNRVLKDKLKSLYSPKLRIFHKEDKSTEAVVGKEYKKQEFILKNMRTSLQIYKDILLNGE